MRTTRFISQYPRYSVQIRQMKVRPLGDGTSQTLDEGLYVQFTPADDGGMIYEKERYTAGEYFNFHGSQQYEDEATPVEVIHRLSVLDTVEDAIRFGWSPEDVAEIEGVLERKCITTPMALMQAATSPVDPPYPAYDQYRGSAQDLVLKLTEDGYDLDQVLLYEASFGQKRPEVIEALKIAIEALKELTVTA